jgi:hypothetical protein
MERVIDPLLADLHMEYEEANQRGRVWKRRWTLLTGHLVFLKTVALSEMEHVMTLLSDCSADDITALKRTLSVSIVVIALATLILEMPPLLNLSFSVSNPKAILYLLPQALVLALPIGFTAGILWHARTHLVASLKGRRVCRRHDLVVRVSCDVGLDRSVGQSGVPSGRFRTRFWK